MSRQYISREVLDEPHRGGDKSAVIRVVQSVLYGYILPGQSRPLGIHTGKTIKCLADNGANEVRYQKYHGFEFMQDLIDEMTHLDPEKRSSIDDVVASHVRESLSEFKLRSPIISKNKPSLFAVFRHAQQALLTLQYIYTEGCYSRFLIMDSCSPRRTCPNACRQYLSYL